MMKEMELYSIWKKNANRELQEELAAIAGDVDAIEDRFYQELEFGTAGLRGIIGAGTNRMNVVMVGKTTQALAEYLLQRYPNPSVAISYDSRIKSEEFAKHAACVLAANGVVAHLYRQLMPTPCLSYAVRQLGCQAGIMVTASHNPAKYNGYKAYGPDGCQMTSESADAVLEISSHIDPFHGVRSMAFDRALEQGNIQYIDPALEQKYLDAVRQCAVHPEALQQGALSVVYTPLNGTGNQPITRLLTQMGVTNLHLVKEQEKPDGMFPTCPFPNPEIQEALALGLRDCERLHPDLLLATDPDADRVGIAVPNSNGAYELVTGNEAGVLMLEYLCRERCAVGTMPEHPVAIKTIVSTSLAQKICEDYGVELRNVLTGFKYIGEQIGLLEEAGEQNRFLFGFEESYGYLAGPYVRDKDAVVASMLLCEMTAFYKNKGLSLLDALQAIYQKYGVYYHTQKSFVCQGSAGMEKMKALMQAMRDDLPRDLGGLRLLTYNDYQSGQSLDLVSGSASQIDLPRSNVLEYLLEGGNSVILRPSGTEPKLKMYLSATAPTKTEALEIADTLCKDCTQKLGFDV